MTVVLAPPPKSVPSSLTPSQVMTRKPPLIGWVVAPLLAPPMAAWKLASAAAAVGWPEPPPRNGVGVAVIGFPWERGASTTLAEELIVIGPRMLAVSLRMMVTGVLKGGVTELDSSR